MHKGCEWYFSKKWIDDDVMNWLRHEFSLCYMNCAIAHCGGKSIYFSVCLCSYHSLGDNLSRRFFATLWMTGQRSRWRYIVSCFLQVRMTFPGDSSGFFQTLWMTGLRSRWRFLRIVISYKRSAWRNPLRRSKATQWNPSSTGDIHYLWWSLRCKWNFPTESEVSPEVKLRW